jgi:hypothetical protein
MVGTYLKEQEVGGGEGAFGRYEECVLAWNVLYEVLAAHEPDLQLPRHRRRSREARQRPAQSNKANKTPYFSSIQIRHFYSYILDFCWKQSSKLQPSSLASTVNGP